MLDFFDLFAAERLERPDYRADFRQRGVEADGFGSWKLERQQHFQEPAGEVSWEAFVRGDWDEAMRLLEAERANTVSEFAGKPPFHRIRVVEWPLVPYLHWELCLLRIRAECGELIRIVGPEQVKPFEDDGPLPELVNVGSETLYRVIYNDSAAPDGALRIIDAGTVARYIAFMKRLWAQGEDLLSFFDREVAPLEPPRGE